MTEETKKYKWSQNSENRNINRAIIDGFIACKHCTLLTNPKFHCEKLDGYNLKKGEEPQCHCPDFINCPAFNQYLNHETLRKHKRNVKESSEIAEEINQSNE